MKPPAGARFSRRALLGAVPIGALLGGSLRQRAKWLRWRAGALLPLPLGEGTGSGANPIVPQTAGARGTGTTAPSPGPTWLKLYSRALANWTLAPDSTDGTRFTLTPRAGAGTRLPTKRVLVLFYKPSSAFDVGMSKILEVTAAKQKPIVFTLLYFKENPALGHQALDFAIARHFDLVAPIGSDAAQFVHDTFQNGPIPSLALMMKDPVLMGWVKDYQHGSGANMAYNSGAVSIDVQMAYLEQFTAQVENIAVLYATTSPSTIEAQVRPLKAYAQQHQLSVLDVAVTDDAQARAQLAAKMAVALAAMAKRDPSRQRSIFLVTGVTSVFDNIATIATNAGGLPVFSMYPNVVQAGTASALFSAGVTYENTAYLAAIYLEKILYQHAKPGDLKVGVVSPPDLAVNFLKARQIGLKVPFTFFEKAGYVYDDQGKPVRSNGENVARPRVGKS